MKKRFIEQPSQMKLLIVVDKLLTRFDAPPATYLYIEKQMQDHGLFQAESEDGKWIRDFYLYRGKSEAVAELAQEAFDDTGDVRLATAIADGEVDFEPVESK